MPSDHVGKHGSGSHAIFSDDHGATWKVSSLIPHGNECQAARAGNGSVVLMMRDAESSERLLSYSHDNGATWSSPVAAFPETECEGSIVALPHHPAGHQLVISSPFSSSRKNMTLHVSSDFGATWHAALQVYPGSSAYSALVRLSPTSVGLVFEQDSYERIVWSAFSIP